MISRITIPLLAFMLLLGACASYQAPPNGEEAYCWRVQQNRHYDKGSDIVFYTNVEPEHDGALVIVREAWFAFHQAAPVIKDHYDRYTEELPLSPELGPITIQRRCPNVQ